LRDASFGLMASDHFYLFRTTSSFTPDTNGAKYALTKVTLSSQPSSYRQPLGLDWQIQGSTYFLKLMFLRHPSSQSKIVNYELDSSSEIDHLYSNALYEDGGDPYTLGTEIVSSEEHITKSVSWSISGTNKVTPAYVLKKSRS